MTARVLIACDGHRHGNPCRGTLLTRADQYAGTPFADAYLEAIRVGWRGEWTGHLCPSRGHDEEPTQ